MAGLSASMTTSTSFLVSLTSASTEDSKPGVLLTLAPAAGQPQPSEQQEANQPDRRRHDRQGGEQHRNRFGVQRHSRRRLGIEPGSHAREKGPGGEDSDSGAQH